MMGRIHADMFFQDRYLLNEVHVKIKLVRSRNSFCLMSAEEFKVKIENAIMFVRQVKLSLSVFLAHAKALDNALQNIQYVVQCVRPLPFQTVFET